MSWYVREWKKYVCSGLVDFVYPKTLSWRGEMQNVGECCGKEPSTKDMAEVAIAAWGRAKGSRFSAMSGEGHILLLCFFLLSWLL